MNKVNFNFHLDKVFKIKMDFTQARLKRRSNQYATADLYPHQTSIYISARVSGKFLKVNSGIKVLPKDWDFSHHKLTRKHPNYFENQNFLDYIKGEAQKRYMSMIMAGNPITPEKVKEMLTEVIKGKVDTSPRKGFYEVLDEFIEYTKIISKPSTTEKYVFLKGHLKEFEKKYRKIRFENIDAQFHADFTSFSVNVKKHLNSTFARYVKCLKRFLRWAKEQGYTVNEQFEKFKPLSEDSNVIFLNKEEFSQIKNINLEAFEDLAKIRDTFVFQCLTGQRYSDIKNLKRGDLITKDGAVEWHLFQIKNNKKEKVFIPLLQDAETILRRFGYLEMKIDQFIVPRISEQYYNRRLKDLGEMAKINDTVTKVNYSGIKRIEERKPKWQFLSSHIARKTFVTLSLEMGMRPEIVRSITGHKSERVLKAYIGINGTMRNREFKDIWQPMLNNN
jgi:integrase